MSPRHEQILRDLDTKGAKHYCLLPGRNIVGSITALVKGKRLTVCITKSMFGYFAAVDYDGLVHSKWASTPSAAVSALGHYMKERIQ